jgi:hypothetical protein
VTGGMEEERRKDAPIQEEAAAASSNLGATLLRVAWLAILLGMAMEGILLVFSAGLGDLLGLGSIIADLAQNVSWSVLVCLGLSVGTAVRSARVPVMGLLGFLAAPAAFEISRVIHKGSDPGPGNLWERRRGPFSVLACPYKGIGIRMPRAGARLGESAPVGRGGGPHGGRVRRGRGLWRNRHSPFGRIGPRGIRHYSLVSGRHRGPLPGRLLAGPLLGGSVGDQYGELRLKIERIPVV